MFDIFADLQIQDGNGANAIEAALQALSEAEVLVGIPEENADRKEGEMTNVDLMYIHSNGSPLVGIPARPVIEPALEANQEKIGSVLSKAAQAALNGNQSGAMAELEKAGMAGAEFARKWPHDPSNAWPPLAESTVQARNRKARNASNSEKQVEFTTQAGTDVSFTANKGVGLNSNPVPLIDTQELLKSITYVVVKGD